MVPGSRQKKVARTLQCFKQTTNTVESVMGSVNSFGYYEDEEMLGLFDEDVLEADSVSEDVDLLLLDWEYDSAQQILGEVSAAIMDRAYQASQATVTRLSPAALQFLY